MFPWSVKYFPLYSSKLPVTVHEVVCFLTCNIFKYFSNIIPPNRKFSNSVFVPFRQISSFKTFKVYMPLLWKLNRCAYGVQFVIICIAVDQSEASYFLEFTAKRFKRNHSGLVCIWLLVMRISASKITRIVVEKPHVLLLQATLCSWSVYIWLRLYFNFPIYFSPIIIDYWRIYKDSLLKISHCLKFWTQNLRCSLSFIRNEEDSKGMERQLQFCLWRRIWNLPTCRHFLFPKNKTSTSSTLLWSRMEEHKTTSWRWSKFRQRTVLDQNVLQLHLVLVPAPEILLPLWCSPSWSFCCGEAGSRLCRTSTPRHCFSKSRIYDAICHRWPKILISCNRKALRQ